MASKHVHVYTLVMLCLHQPQSFLGQFIPLYLSLGDGHGKHIPSVTTNDCMLKLI